MRVGPRFNSCLSVSMARSAKLVFIFTQCLSDRVSPTIRCVHVVVRVKVGLIMYYGTYCLHFLSNLISSKPNLSIISFWFRLRKMFKRTPEVFTRMETRKKRERKEPLEEELPQKEEKTKKQGEKVAAHARCEPSESCARPAKGKVATPAQERKPSPCGTHSVGRPTISRAGE